MARPFTPEERMAEAYVRALERQRAEHPGLDVSVSCRSGRPPIGRFGGGWQWKVGVQTTRLTRSHVVVLISLLVLEVRIRWQAATSRPSPS